MKSLISSKFGWIILLIIIILINWLGWFWHFRLDLTQEKRYTLSNATRQLLRNLDEPVTVEVFLDGDMPAGFRKLANSTRDILQDFRDAGKNNIRFKFRKPLEGLNDSARLNFKDSLQHLGLSPINVQAQTSEGEGHEERFIYPGALLHYAGRMVAVDFLQGQSSENGINSLNNAEALLEYKLTSAINKLTEDTIPAVGYLLGNGEPWTYNVYDLIEHNIKRNYRFGFVQIDSESVISPEINLLVILKPTRKFTEDQKFKIDQFVMHGGRLLWMIDNLYADMDSLARSQNEFIAFDRALNLEDQLFKYGVRINQDLVQDLNCDRIPSQIEIIGGKPQIELLPWPYFPLLSNYSNHPIAKNLDYVLAQFPNSIDTVKAPGIRKTFLLSSSDATRILETPARVAWNFIQTKEDASKFNQSSAQVAVLLEGKFNSIFTNRLSKSMKDSLNATRSPFLAECPESNKMIVVSNAEIAMNSVSESKGPLPMGMNPYTKYKYANSEFVMNAIEWLVDHSGIMESRSKDYTLRLLDKKKLEGNKFKWPFINIVLPIILVILFGLVYQALRVKKYRG
jgi:gliding-associated putative ABC transporter substrate-binding component GldG